MSLDGGDESSSGVQNFAPLPTPCYFLKGVGESASSAPVDPRWIRYKMAKDLRSSNEKQIAQRSKACLKAKESVVAQLEGELAKQKQFIEDLERQMNKSNTSTANKRQRTAQGTSPA